MALSNASAISSEVMARKIASKVDIECLASSADENAGHIRRHAIIAAGHTGMLPMPASARLTSTSPRQIEVVTSSGSHFERRRRG
ncbi:hypothetical protein [Sinorhizobium sp. 22678]|uniref:hypothetical protein n=1 Tax=Sinorhizobium sp. 22678 TaxID=3453955 RepID=UPI003F876FF2